MPILIEKPWFRSYNVPQLLLQWIEENPNIEIILELGTGGHHLTGQKAASLGIKTIGITLCLKEVAEFEKLYASNPSLMEHYQLMFLNWHYFDASMFPKFDAIFAIDIAHHYIGGVSQPLKFETVEKTFRSLMNALKPKGKLFLGNAISRSNSPQSQNLKPLAKKYKDKFPIEYYYKGHICFTNGQPISFI